MPGRHSGGSNLGGGFGGGGAGFGGGGGWRPSGPWNPRPYSSGGFGFPWLLMGLLPWLFGGRYGRGGGGCGCGGLGCLIFLCLFFLVISGGMGTFTRGYTTNPGYDPNYNAPVSGGQSGLAGEPPQVQTQTALDLRELHAALDKRIPQWQQQLTPNEFHTISGQEAGLTQDNNTKELDYGKCGNALYVFVVLNTRPDTGPADGEGYAYTTAASPASCHPPSWNVYDSQDVGGGWWFVTLKSVPNANQGR
jgi:uncharacterized membrane protein